MLAKGWLHSTKPLDAVFHHGRAEKALTTFFLHTFSDEEAITSWGNPGPAIQGELSESLVWSQPPPQLDQLGLWEVMALFRQVLTLRTEPLTDASPPWESHTVLSGYILLDSPRI